MKRLLIVLSLLAPVCLTAQPGEERVRWLQEHTIPIRSATPVDTAFDDLEAVGAAIGDARVVFLGEQTHGDGTTFLMKTLLIKYLHEKKGFEVLAFESGIYDMAKAWEFMRGGEAPTLAARRGVFAIWARSEQLLPLFDYLGVRAKSDRPLELAGFDSQPTASASADLFMPALDSLVLSTEISLADVSWPATRAMLDTLMTPGGYMQAKPSEERRHELFRMLDTLGARLSRQRDQTPSLAFWKQVVRSVRAHATYSLSYDMSKPQDLRDLGNARDRQMAENLLWLVRQRYTGRKVIVWAASYHAMRNPSEVTNVPAYKEIETLGNLVTTALGSDVYAIAFLASQGIAAPWMQKPRMLPPVTPDGIDGLWSKTSHAFGMIDFRKRTPGDEWLHEELAAGPMGYAPLRARWPRMFDAMLYTRVMEASTRARQ